MILINENLKQACEQQLKNIERWAWQREIELDSLHDRDREILVPFGQVLYIVSARFLVNPDYEEQFEWRDSAFLRLIRNDSDSGPFPSWEWGLPVLPEETRLLPQNKIVPLGLCVSPMEDADHDDGELVRLRLFASVPENERVDCAILYWLGHPDKIPAIAHR